MPLLWIGLTGVAVLLYALDILRVLRTPICGIQRRMPSQRIRISVLIPARNEAARIGPCLAGLAVQSYRDFEVIVIDDHSSDDTAHVVHGYQKGLPQLTIVPGAPLPAGWAGKNWACWQAAEHAQGDWLLFLDADVIPKPELLAALASISSEYDMVSLLPRMLLGTWAERLILPAFLELLAGIYPFEQVNKPESSLAFAIGQCLMFRRSSYDRLDGHRAVCDSVLEDMDLAQRAKQSGMRTYAAEAPDLLAVRMYHGWSSLSEGLTKNAMAGARHGGVRSVLIACQRLVLGWLPAQLLILGWLAGLARTPMLWLVCMVLLSTQIAAAAWITGRRFKIPAVWGVLMPVGTLVYFMIAAYGFIRLWFGIGVYWKGRILHARQ